MCESGVLLLWVILFFTPEKLFFSWDWLATVYRKPQGQVGPSLRSCSGPQLTWKQEQCLSFCVFPSLAYGLYWDAGVRLWSSNNTSKCFLELGMECLQSSVPDCHWQNGAWQKWIYCSQLFLNSGIEEKIMVFCMMYLDNIFKNILYIYYT